MSLEQKTELYMIINEYEPRNLKKQKNGLDITALDGHSDDKILLRVITKSRSKSGIVGTDTVQKMVTTIENENYDRGILICKSFTEAAKRILDKTEGIKRLSEYRILDFEPSRLYLAAKNIVDELCKTKCGKIPQKKSDCKGYTDGHYTCEIRLVSDNLYFHLKQGWNDLLQKDVLRLLSMHRSVNG